MKQLYILILFFVFPITFAQTGNENNVLEAKIATLSEEIKKATKLNESLKEDLLFYKVKEDYYAAALSEQANRFSVIIAICFGLLALASFSWYRLEQRIINSKFQKLSSKIESIQTDINKNENEINLLSGSFARYTSDQLHHKKEYYKSFLGYLFEALTLLKAADPDAKNYVLPALKSSKEALEKLKDKPFQVNKLKDFEEATFQEIKEIEELGDLEVRQLCAEIRILFHKILDE